MWIRPSALPRTKDSGVAKAVLSVEESMLKNFDSITGSSFLSDSEESEEVDLSSSFLWYFSSLDL